MVARTFGLQNQQVFLEEEVFKYSQTSTKFVNTLEAKIKTGLFKNISKTR